jgi:hypothetical protein
MRLIKIYLMIEKDNNMILMEVLEELVVLDDDDLVEVFDE